MFSFKTDVKIYLYFRSCLTPFGQSYYLKVFARYLCLQAVMTTTRYLCPGSPDEVLAKADHGAHLLALRQQAHVYPQAVPSKQIICVGSVKFSKNVSTGLWFFPFWLDHFTENYDSSYPTLEIRGYWLSCLKGLYHKIVYPSPKKPIRVHNKNV